MKPQDRDPKIIQRYLAGQVSAIAAEYDLSERQVRRVLTRAGLIRKRAENGGQVQFNVKLSPADLETLQRKAEQRRLGLAPYVVQAGKRWAGGLPKKV